MTPEEIQAVVRYHVQRFHNSRSTIVVVPEIQEALEQLARHDPRGVEWGIALLEADPWHFRSGYLKQDVARYLRAMPLSEGQARRIQLALLSAIAKGRREDTAQYAKLARRVDDPRFRSELAALASGPDASTATRAGRLLAKCRLNDTREDLRGAR